MDNFFCGGYYFSSNFDSGNLAKVELVKLFEGLPPSENLITAEINIWTKPDCAGTKFENLNRSWFFFSIHGGLPNSVCKINIVNLNKQSKLFSQGMHPVTKIGDNGKWELTKDKPSYSTDSDNFTLSFLHKIRQNTELKYYYAFTFPFTYTDCQNQLDLYDRMYSRTLQQEEYIINRIYNINEGTSKRDDDANTMKKVDDSSSSLMWNDNCDINKNDMATQHEYDTEKIEFDIYSVDDLKNEIYYCRELLISSHEKRNIELLTITSFHGIQMEREENLKNLFPNFTKPRCHKFANKKIIFISSRVHPGETPASFVLNGFLKLLLDKKSIIASCLRKLYVFKIVPFLNPDGVYNGCYRSDILGQNLNRLYICPKLDMQPSIYAVKKLIRYYHNGEDLQDYIDDTFNCSENIDAIKVDLQKKKSDTKHDWKENDRENTIIETFQSNFSDSDVLLNEEDHQQNTITTTPTTKASTQTEYVPEPKPINLTSLTGLSTNKKQLNRLKTDSKLKLMKNSNQASSMSANKIFGKSAVAGGATGECQSTSTLIEKRNTTHRKKHLNRESASTSNLVGSYIMSMQKMNKSGIEQQHHHHHSHHHHHHHHSANSNDHNNDCSIFSDKSTIFLYIDLHSHASKKGVFMYGNYLPNLSEAVECMLLPRLMSMNSHHFHYDACVFSERNMYHKGKRDGLSKEGSGRVAIYKTIGLVKSYTLESNYNTGKYVNLLPPKGKESCTKKINLNVPKYTPAIFEEVGRALGPSILDLTDSNPVSRLQNSEFKSLQGLRNWLRYELHRLTTNQTPITTKTMRKFIIINAVKRKRNN